MSTTTETRSVSPQRDSLVLDVAVELSLFDAMLLASVSAHGGLRSRRADAPSPALVANLGVA